jgi:uncharacterized protein
MRMATEPIARRALLAAAAGLAVPAWPASASRAALFAAWDATDRGVGSHRIGLLDLSAAAVRVQAALDVPTRAHGLAVEPDGTLLAVARRPGDWLVRWRPTRGQALWHWNGGGRTFNGHIERRGDEVFTTETDNESGGGLIVLRDAATLRERALWPTHGRDPHDFLFNSDGALWVANGGIGADAASGRMKDTRAMDSSLVRLDARTGELTGQWRLPDARLSLRHLAQTSNGRIGVAMQAEHDDAAQRAAAPLLAVWHQEALRVVGGPPAAGYGGDIAAIGSRFFVSATRANTLLNWTAESGWSERSDVAQVCALVVADQRLWCGSAAGWVSPDGQAWRTTPTLRLDNHAIAAR